MSGRTPKSKEPLSEWLNRCGRTETCYQASYRYDNTQREYNRRIQELAKDKNNMETIPAGKRYLTKKAEMNQKIKEAKKKKEESEEQIRQLYQQIKSLTEDIKTYEKEIRKYYELYVKETKRLNPKKY